MTRSQLVFSAVVTSLAFRSGERDPVALAAAVNDRSALAPLTLTDAYGLALQAGATPAEIQESAELPTWLVERLAASLSDGNLTGAQGLLLTAEARAPGLVSRLRDVIEGRRTRHLDAVAEADGDVDPAALIDVTPADVIDALAL